jgi:hypothetical protein
MKKNINKGKFILLFYILLTGCNMTNEQKYSDDLNKLKTVVELDTSPSAIRWEIFGTPEYSGGVPGPTDFVTLVAEVPNLDQVAFEKRPKSGAIWVAPEAARPWLSENFRSMLRKYRNTSVDLPSSLNCRAAHGKLKKTGQPVFGFICNGPEKAMIYLTLVKPSLS